MNDAWATTTCEPLIGNISAYDFEESSSSRTDALLASMQKLVQRQLDGDFEASEAQEDATEYTDKLRGVATPGFVVAAIRPSASRRTEFARRRKTFDARGAAALRSGASSGSRRRGGDRRNLRAHTRHAA